jgi:hypothetical protein
MPSLKYLIYAMQNSPCGTPQAHGSDLAPVKYPTGVTDSCRKYFSWQWSAFQHFGNVMHFQVPGTFFQPKDWIFSERYLK